MSSTATPDFRFLLSHTPLERVFQRWVESDMRGAQLSLAYRAYYGMRALLPLSIRQRLQRWRTVRADARWCFPDAFFDAFHAESNGSNQPWTIVDPWPDGARFAFVMTHDVETAEGQARIGQIADLEQELGFRSSWNFVPYKYPLDFALIDDLRSRGFEIGVHGYNHDGRLFASRAEFDRRVPHINAAIARLNARGFRAPMVHRNLAWMQSLDIAYDASCFDADPFQAMPGGVGGLWPFIAGKFVELPYTLPQDHTLFVALGHRTGALWEEKLNWIAQRRGMALAIVHPDYMDAPGRLDAYREFLVRATEQPGRWQALPHEVAQWWRLRDQSLVAHDARDQPVVKGPAATRACPAQVEVADNGVEIVSLANGEARHC